MIGVGVACIGEVVVLIHTIHRCGQGPRSTVARGSGRDLNGHHQVFSAAAIGARTITRYIESERGKIQIGG